MRSCLRSPDVFGTFRLSAIDRSSGIDFRRSSAMSIRNQMAGWKGWDARLAGIGPRIPRAATQGGSRERRRNTDRGWPGFRAVDTLGGRRQVREAGFEPTTFGSG